MSFLLHATRPNRASMLVLGVAALLGSCQNEPTRVVEPPAAPLTGDAGVTGCTHPAEGCPCTPGELPVECIVDPPITRNGQIICQHGTRVCRDSAWSACENLVQFVPSGNKDLGTPAAASTCHPDDFTQVSTPTAADLTPTNSTNIAYTSTVPTGITLTSVSSASIPNFGLGADNDGDGVPDMVGLDDCLNDPLHWRLPCTGTITDQGFFHILPQGTTAPIDPMHVDLTVKNVDAYILVDTTASMGEEIANLRTGLSTLTTNIRTVIPGTYFGLGMYREFPVYIDSQNNDFPFIHLLDSQSSVPVMQGIVNNSLNTEGNSFWPEAGAQALYAVASGKGLGAWVPNRYCANGGFGYPCFRPGTVPVVIIATDAPFWNGASFAAPVGNTRRRPELSHVPYPGTAGSTSMAGQNLPLANATSATGQVIRGNDTHATAWNLGDLTNSSVTVLGSNDGVGAGNLLVNNFTETCGGRTPSGPDVYYSFTINQRRNFIFETYADFDPTMYLRQVSSGTPTTVACDLDSGRLNDANGTATWRTGSKIISSTIPGVGAATTTSVAFSNCSAGSSNSTVNMTNCSVATSTDTVSLTSCTVPQVTTSAAFAGCSIPSTTTSASLTGCTVPSTTTTPVSGCTMGTTTSTSNFTGCTVGTTTTTSNLKSCTVNVTTPTGAYSSCTNDATPSTAVSGCAINDTTPTATLTSCTYGNTTPHTDVSGCTARPVSNLTGCAYTATTPTTTYGTCTAPNVTPSGTLTRCQSAAYTPTSTLSGCTYVDTTPNTTYTGCTATDNTPTGSASGCTGATPSATLTGCSNVANVPTATLSACRSYDYNISLVSCRVLTNREYIECDYPWEWQSTMLGFQMTGTGIPAGYDIIDSTYYSTSSYVFRLSAAVPAGTVGSNLTISRTNRIVGCTIASGSGVATNPTAGMVVSYFDPDYLDAGATITAAKSTTYASWVIDLSTTSNNNGYAGLGSSPYITTFVGTTYYGTTLTCTGATGDVIASGMTLSGTGIAGGTTISSFTGTYSITMSAAATASVGSSITATGGGGYSKTIQCTTNSGSTANAWQVTGTNVPASTTLTAAPTGGATKTYVLSNTPTGAITSMAFRNPTTTYSTSVSCTGHGNATNALNTWTVSGTGVTGALSANVTGAGPYALTLGTAPTTASVGTITARQAASTYGTTLTCTTASGDPPLDGYTSTGGTLGVGTVSSVTAVGSGYSMVTSSAGVGGTLSGTLRGPAGGSNTVVCGTNGNPFVASPAVSSSWFANGSGVSLASYIAAGTTMTANSLSANGKVYTITLSAFPTTAFTTNQTVTFTSATPAYGTNVSCTTHGNATAPAAGWLVSGTGVSGTLTSVTGSGPFTVNLGTAPTASSISTITLTSPTPTYSLPLVCTGYTGNPPSNGDTLTGSFSGTITSAPTVVGSGYSFNTSAAASSTTGSARSTGGGALSNTLKCTTRAGTSTGATTTWVVTGTNVPASTTVNALPSMIGTDYVYPLSNTPTMDVASAVITDPTATYSNTMTCTGNSGSAPMNAYTYTITSGGSGSGTITSAPTVVGSGYSFTTSGSGGAGTFGVTARSTTTTYGNILDCSVGPVVGVTPAINWKVTGTNVPGSGTTTLSAAPSMNGALFRYTLSANATGPVSTVTLQNPTPIYGATLTCATRSGTGTPAATWNLTGTNVPVGATISSVSGAGPYTVVMSSNPGALVTAVTASSPTATYGSTLQCQVDSAILPVVAPANGMALSGTGIPVGTTITAAPTLAAGVYTIAMSANATALPSVVTGTSTSPDLTSLANCTLASGAVPVSGMIVTGTNLGAGTTTINSAPVLTAGKYSFAITPSAATAAATASSATITSPDLTRFTGCTVTGIAPAVGQTVGGTFLSGGATVSAVTGAGPYAITMSAAASSNLATLTSLTSNTPQLDRMTGCTMSGGPLANNMVLSASARLAAGTTISSFTGSGTGPYTVMLSTNALSTGATTATATLTAYQRDRFTGCSLMSGTVVNGMTLTGTNLGAAPTISSFTGTGAGPYTIFMSSNATSDTATLASGSLTVNQTDRLTGCMVATGALVSNMALTGTLLPVGERVSSFTGTGAGPYTVWLTANATGVGATTAAGSITNILPQLTGCLDSTGSTVLTNGLGVSGTGIPAGTTITNFGGLGAAGNPWTIDLSATPTVASSNITMQLLIPSPANTLTGCTLPVGDLPIVNMNMSGALIAAGSTLVSYTTVGSTYTLTLSDFCTGLGPTDAFGTITTPPSSAGGYRFPVGLDPGDYEIVVDSASFNPANSGSSPGMGTFQLRISNLSAPSTSTTAATEVTWASTVAALNARGVKTIGVASCPLRCTDLDTKQTAVATCIQGATPTLTSGADNTSINTTRCGRAYNTCIGKTWASVARCTQVFNNCRSSEVTAAQQNNNISSAACTSAYNTCNTQCTGAGAVCTSAVRTTDCTAVRTACTSPTTDVCATERTAVNTCLTASTSTSDAATYCDETIYDLQQLGVQTGSVRSDGTPFVYNIETNGNGLTSAIADGVRDLAQYILFDVTATCETAGSVGCSSLFQSANISSVGNPANNPSAPNCASCSGPTCLQCTPGATLPYDVLFSNPTNTNASLGRTGVVATNVPQIFDFFIVLRDGTGVEMSRAPVRIVVPALTTSTFSPTGTFTQIYDGTYSTANNVGCMYALGRRADWGSFTYTADVPSGTSVVFSFQTADTIAGLATANTTTYSVVASASGATFDVGAILQAATATDPTITNYKPYLKLTTTLNANATLTAAPTVQTYNMQYTCVDVE